MCRLPRARLCAQQAPHRAGAGASILGRIGISIFRIVNGALYRDKVRAEALIRGSAVDWVIVRPPGLAVKPERGTYRARENLDASVSKVMSHTDVADFMVKALSDAQWTGKAVELSY